MRQFAMLMILAVASMAGSKIKSAINTLGLPVITAFGILMFSGFFIFTVMSAHSPVQWKLSIRLPKPVGTLKDMIDLMGVIVLIAATAVILAALAATGPDQSFPESLMNVIKCMPRILDV